MTAELVNKIRSRWEKKNNRNLIKHVKDDHTKNIEIYFANLKNKWSNILDNRIRIYLDQRIWIDIQRVFSNRSNNQNAMIIYSKLKDLVETGKVVCPISSATYWEIMKQSDPLKRIQIAKVIDELSEGFMVKHWIEILEIEVKNISGSKAATFSKVWNRIGMVEYSYNARIPIDPVLDMPADLNSLEARKFIIEILSEITFEEYIPFDSISKPMVNNMEMEIKKELDRVKTENPKEDYRSFEDMHKSELEGIIRASGCAIDLSIDQILKNIELMRGIMPLSYAISGLHALLRNDAGREYDKNDHFDIQHSSIGLAYCDIIFTEKSFTHLMHQGPLYLSKSYDTEVLYEEKKMVECLSKIF